MKDLANPEFMAQMQNDPMFASLMNDPRVNSLFDVSFCTFFIFIFAFILHLFRIYPTFIAFIIYY